MESWVAILFWDVLQITQKNIYINSHGISYLPVSQRENVEYDVSIILGMYSISSSRISVRHEKNLQNTFLVFVQCVAHLIAVSQLRRDVNYEWLNALKAFLQVV